MNGLWEENINNSLWFTYWLITQQMLVDIKIIQQQGASHTMHHDADVGCWEKWHLQQLFNILSCRVFKIALNHMLHILYIYIKMYDIYIK